ncbi:MAG: hypothetical protein K0S49_883, partial [Microbacterium sp.]|nr:hypothetical protein [Microbacterium sp.]
GVGAVLLVHGILRRGVAARAIVALDRLDPATPPASR